MPKPKARTFHGEFGLGETEGGFNLPAASVGEDNAPGIIDGKNRVIGQQIPGFATTTRAGNDQPELVSKTGEFNGCEEDASFAPAASAAVPNVAIAHRALAASDFPGIHQFAFGIDQSKAFGPAHNKAQAILQDQTEPGDAGKTSVPNMDDLLSPGLPAVFE